MLIDPQIKCGTVKSVKDDCMFLKKELFLSGDKLDKKHLRTQNSDCSVT